MGLWSRWRSKLPRPQYDDRHFWSSIAGMSAARGVGLLRQGADQFVRGQRDEAFSSLLEHFDGRVTPHFFVDARTVISPQTKSEPRLNTWMRAAAAEIRDATENGLKVYGVPIAPLRPGFPWQGQDDSAVRDLLVAARPHRLGFAPRMALSVCHGGSNVEDFRVLLEDWMQFAAAQPGLPYCSNLVAFQRLVAAAWAYAFLAAAPDSAACAASRVCLLKIINQDVRYLLPRLGDAYPNNHLLIDRFADWFIALIFPEFRSDRYDLETIEAEWLRELFNQTYEDGGGFEHSVYYHGLGCEMAAAYLLLADANSRPVADDVSTRIGRMLRLQAELCGPDGNAPDIGDASDDPIFPLDAGGGGHAAPLREICRALFAPAMSPVHHDHPGVERAFWLLGGKLAPITDSDAEAHFSEYPESGVAIFLADAEATRCTFRTGPKRGTRLMSGHMHSDLLSVTLTCHGIPFLVDPGTCTYRFGPTRGLDARVNLRKYFAGPGAHNGFAAGDRDPLGAMTADFRDKATIPDVRHVARAANRTLAFIEAELRADEFPRVARGVIHVRDVCFLVYNLVHEPSAGSNVSLPFQFASGCTLQRERQGQWRASRAGAELALVFSDGLEEAQLIVGREYPTNGWISSGYGVRVAAPQLTVEVAQSRSLTGLAIFDGVGVGAMSMSCAEPSANARCFRIESEEYCDYVLVNVGPVDDVVTAWGVTFRGRVAWLRVSSKEGTRIRWLEGISCVAPTFGLKYEYDEVQEEFCP